DDEIAAEALGAVLEGVIDGWAERQAVARPESMDDGAFVEGQGAVEDPDLLVNEGVGCGGKRQPRAGGQLEFGELQQPVARRREGAAAIAGLRILPALLIGGSGEP